MDYEGRSLDAVLQILQVTVMQPLSLNNFSNPTSWIYDFFPQLFLWLDFICCDDLEGQELSINKQDNDGAQTQ